MNKTIPKFLIPMLIIFAVGLYGQDQCQIANCTHEITAGDQHGHCPTCDVELNGETEFEDHCTNNEDHCPEPSGDGGSGGGQGYGEHTLANCIAKANCQHKYTLNGVQYAIYMDPDTDCDLVIDAIPNFEQEFTCPDCNVQYADCAELDDHIWNEHLGGGSGGGGGDPASFAGDEQGCLDNGYVYCDDVEDCLPDGHICGGGGQSGGDPHSFEHDPDACVEAGFFYCHNCGDCFPATPAHTCGGGQSGGDPHSFEHDPDACVEAGFFYCHNCGDCFPATPAHTCGGGQSGGGCDPDGDYPTDPPGEDNPGCIDYDDCNGNNVYDLSEPCYDND